MSRSKKNPMAALVESIRSSTTIQTIYEKYLEHTQNYKAQYGERTIILMMVGSFFEVYGLKDNETGIISGSDIAEFSKICQMNISEKRR